uniref:Potassium channel subfamily T member 2 n=1 Tax=Acrobeloides nanus TaxID=290746 RepID=A0A914CUN9_9BILA
MATNLWIPFWKRNLRHSSFRYFGVCLVGAKRNEPGSQILLNPGHSFLIQRLDRLYYIALTNEESLTDFTKGVHAQKKQVNFASSIANLGPAGLEFSSTVEVPEEKEAGLKLKWKKRRRLLMKLTTTDAEPLMPGNNREIERRSSVGIVTGEWASSESEEEEGCDICVERCIEESIIKTTPPVSAYIGPSVNLCHMLKEKRSFCCLQISEPCEHCKFVSPREYGWQNPAIIVAVDQPSSGLFKLLLPLRAFYRPVHELQPIILLLEIEDNQKPSSAFLDVIAWFPLIYWMPGKISSLDNLLSAGICLAEHIIVVKEVSSAVEEHLADCTTIITAQKIHSMFPKLKLITELTYSSNMRFMQFDPYDSYALQQSKLEKRERKHGSNLAFMFRLPFAQGGVFSANMLDRLLYQAFVKTYLVDFLKILLGIDQSPSSGYLASIKITEDDMWIRTYGRLYQKLCSSVADIPIGVYRTKQMGSKTISIEMERHSSEAEKRTETLRHRREFMKELMKSRMQNLGMAADDYNNAEHEDEKRKTLSYVIINPAFDLELEPGDVVYVLRAPIREDTRSKRINPRAGLFRAPNISSHTSLLNTYPEEASSAQCSLAP